METFAHFGDESVESRARRVYHGWQTRVAANAEEVTSCLLGMQWLSAVFALLTAAWYWRIGPMGSLLPIWLAMLATACSGLPLLLIALQKGDTYGRFAVAFGQTIWSLLLIEISGHRIETYAHLFGSLLLLSLFNDIRVLVVASAVIFIHIAISSFSGREGAPMSASHEAFWVLLCVAWLGHRTVRQRRAAQQDAQSQAKRDLHLQAAGRDLSENHRQLNCLRQALEAALVDDEAEQCVIDNRGNVICANSLWQQHWGHPARLNLLEMAQRTPGPWGLGGEKVESALRSAIEAGVPFKDEVAYDNGQWSHVEIRPLAADGVHNVAGAMVIQRDTQDTLEQQLIELEIRLQRALETAEQCEDAVAQLDEQGRILHVAGGWEEVTGTPLDRVQGERLHRILARSDADARGLAAIDACLEKQKGCDAVFECERPDGSSYQAKCRIRPISNAAQEFIGFVAYHRDISQQRSLEDENQKLQCQVTEAAKHAASVAMTHSALENVADALTTANVMTGLVLNRVKSFAPTRIEQAGALIEQHVDDLAAFVRHDEQGRHLPAYLKSLASRISRENNLLKEEIGRLQTGIVAARDLVERQKDHTRLAQFLEPVQLNDILRDALLAVPMGDDVQVVEAMDNALPKVHADRRKLMQVMVNLLSNARHALRVSGKTALTLQVRTFLHDDKVVLEIADNGCGIPPERIRRVFRRGNSAWAEGRGYGLYCSQQAAEEMGGELAAQSEGESSGATFRFALPLRLAMSGDFAMGSSANRSPALA